MSRVRVSTAAVFEIMLVCGLGTWTSAMSSTLRVDSNSMAPGLCRGDYIAVFGLGISRPLRPRTLSRGVIAVFRTPDGARKVDNPEVIVKRVVAVGGDSLRILNGALIVNGRVVQEPYVHHGPHYNRSHDAWPIDLEGAGVRGVTVPDNHSFLLGDNRDDSRDSRAFGPVANNALIGSVGLVLMRPAAADERCSR